MSAARRSSRALRAVALPAVLAVLAALAGCGGPGGSAATTDVVACAPALPLARSIVHDQGVPVLIRRIARPDADRLSHELHAPPPPAPAPRPAGAPRPTPDPAQAQVPKMCLFVYSGQYPAGRIAGATPPATAGTYALMVLRVRHPAVDRILVTPALPPDTRPRPWWQRVLDPG